MDDLQVLAESRNALLYLLPILLLVSHPFNSRPSLESLRRPTIGVAALHTLYAVSIDYHFLTMQSSPGWREQSHDDTFWGGLCALLMLFSLVASLIFGLCICPKLGGGEVGFLGATALGVLLFFIWWVPIVADQPTPPLTVAALTSTVLSFGVVYRVCR